MEKITRDAENYLPRPASGTTLSVLEAVAEIPEEDMNRKAAEG